MIYKNGEMKVDQLIGYFNSNKISLIPPFQRGTVWSLPMRRKLIENMLRRYPIPAVFLYKDPQGGPTFTYNILDGKQRLETLLLFIGDRSDVLQVQNLKDYFFHRPIGPKAKPGRKAKASPDRSKNFTVSIDDSDVTFATLKPDLVRPFVDYAIPVIEIEMDEDRAASLYELTQLFVDINTYGKKVTRFSVIKAMNDDPLIKDIYGLIALKQMRGKTPYSKLKDSPFASVLKNLNTVSRLTDSNARVDLVWERLVEVALYARTKQHRRPAEVLNAFFKPDVKSQINASLSKEEREKLRYAFKFLADGYAAASSLKASRLATDQPLFYTVITTLLTTDLRARIGDSELIRRLTRLGKLLEDSPEDHPQAKSLSELKESAIRTTSDPGRRTRRQTLLVNLLGAM